MVVFIISTYTAPNTTGKVVVVIVLAGFSQAGESSLGPQVERAELELEATIGLLLTGLGPSGIVICGIRFRGTGSGRA